MSDDKTISRLKQVHRIGGLLDKAKANPWVLIVLALGGGKGTEELLAQVTTWNVQWYWVAAVVVGWALMGWMRDVSATLTKILERLGDGDVRFEEHEKRIEQLEARRQKPRSQPSLSPHPAS